MNTNTITLIRAGWFVCRWCLNWVVSESTTEFVLPRVSLDTIDERTEDEAAMAFLLSKSSAFLQQRSFQAATRQITFLRSSAGGGSLLQRREISQNSQKRNESKFKQWHCAALLGGFVAGSYAIYSYTKNDEMADDLGTVLAKTSPVYTSIEVAKHKTEKDRIWVTYKDGVYDITEFVKVHPGGNKILLGAGSAIDPFWNLYAVHQTPEVLDMLEEYRIGNLRHEDQKSQKDMNNPFASEPYRFPIFRVNSPKPFNAEPPLEVLTDSFITPNELFYVRNHLPVPDVDPKKFSLEVVVGGKSRRYSLNDLRKFPWVTITTTIQCAGNRREEMSRIKPVKGLSWGASAIGTARWSGPRLRDVLMASGLNPKDPAVQHIQFDGLDHDITNAAYGASIPVKKALNHDEDVILALKMNGEDIPRDHGYPLRVIVPGTVGARNVKWLHRVVASNKESDSHWQQKDYKLFSPSTTYETADYNKVPAIQDLPVTSAINWPQPNSTITPEDDGTIKVTGYAWSGGGRDIIRVDVSGDGGETWQEAELIKDSEVDDSSKVWPWTLWNVDVPVKIGSQADIICKAVDSSYNTQPERMEPIWNLRGFLGNSWYRMKVNVVEDDE